MDSIVPDLSPVPMKKLLKPPESLSSFFLREMQRSKRVTHVMEFCYVLIINLKEGGEYQITLFVNRPQNNTGSIGLMVIQSNPFRYKIVRVSEPLPWERRKTSVGFYNLNCEVFDSDTYAWKRLNDLVLPSGEFLWRSEKPESLYGFLHWLTWKNNVIQFCMQTETWSFFPLPEDVIGDGSSLDLVSYEGKLAVLCSNSNLRGGYDLWVLDNSSGKSWAKVKDVQVTDSEDKHAKPLWFLSNDVILVAGFCRVGLYNTNSNKFRYLHTTTQESLPYYLPSDVCFPFYSNFERICLNHTGRSKTKRS